MVRLISRAETLDLSAFRLPMQPIPARVEEAIAKGVVRGEDPPRAPAPTLLLPEADGRADGVRRNGDGTLTIACLTEMPGVRPEMIDWWFGWHLTSSERYRLWHPKAHQKCAAAFDRASARDLRSRYVGNIVHVDEQIGPGLQRLAVAFRPASEFGLDPARVDGLGTAICARTAQRANGLEIGRFIHVVKRTPDGSEMLSRLYLGEVRSTAPLVGPLIAAFFNTRRRRRRLIRDEFGLYLLRHCAEEMNHLARILPGLYERFGA
jgi:hypothetical protein